MTVRRIYIGTLVMLIPFVVACAPLRMASRVQERATGTAEVGSPPSGISPEDQLGAVAESTPVPTPTPGRIEQDLTCINVMPEQIVMRQAQTDLLHWTPPGPEEEPAELDPKSPGTTPQFVVDTILPTDL